MLTKGEKAVVIAEVIINSNVKNLNKTFDYIIPTTLEETVVEFLYLLEIRKA